MDRKALAAARYAKMLRRHEELREQEAFRETTVEKAIELVTPDLTVKHGPFSGLRYPRAEPMGSVLFPRVSR